MDILLIIEGEIATTQLIEQVLSACRQYGLTYRKRLLSSLKHKDIQPYTIPLFVRCGDPSVQLWVELLKLAKRPYLYYIDDNFWEIEGETPLAHYYQHPLVRNSLDLVVSNANLVLTNSNELANYIARFNQNLSVLPAFFDFSLLNQIVPESTDEIRIGFAGSSSRIDDLEIIRPLINPILEKFSNVVFEFAGVLPKGITENDRIRFFPHTTEYKQFIRFQAERNWAIGLAPLIDNESNRCKTNNKYREYSACKIVGIYSDMTPYSQSVKNNVTGILVKNSIDAWMAAISYMVNYHTVRQEMAVQAYNDVKQSYCVNYVSRLWFNDIENTDILIRKQPVLSLQYANRKLITKIIFIRIKSIWLRISRSYGEGGLLYVTGKIANRFLRFASNDRGQ